MFKFRFTCARMYFPHAIQEGHGKCEHDTWQKVKKKIITLCRHRKPSTIVDFTYPHC